MATHSIWARVVCSERIMLGRATLIMLLSMVARKTPVATRKNDGQGEDGWFRIRENENRDGESAGLWFRWQASRHGQKREHKGAEGYRRSSG